MYVVIIKKGRVYSRFKTLSKIQIFHLITYSNNADSMINASQI